MVGLLNAPRGTRLYTRLKEEGRLLKETSGDNTDFSLNFTPKMDQSLLLKGYQEVISGIYSCEAYYKRIRKFVSEFNPLPKTGGYINFRQFGCCSKTDLSSCKKTKNLGKFPSKTPFSVLIPKNTGSNFSQNYVEIRSDVF